MLDWQATSYPEEGDRDSQVTDVSVDLHIIVSMGQ